MTPVAPRILNDVSCVTGMKQASHYAWHAQYLVRLDRDTCCSAHCKYVSYVTRINRACRFVVRRSTGVVLCSTE